VSIPTLIAQALSDIIIALTDVDQAAIDSYLPPVQTKSVALVIPPFGQQSRIDALTTAGSRYVPERQTVMMSHRIPLELWVKIDTGHLAQTITRARELPTLAIQAILANATLNNTVDRVGNYGPGDNTASIETDTFDRPVQIDGVPYIVIAITVPVIAYLKNE
jgi:hypothetical protein